MRHAFKKCVLAIEKNCKCLQCVDMVIQLGFVSFSEKCVNCFEKCVKTQRNLCEINVFVIAITLRTVRWVFCVFIIKLSSLSLINNNRIYLAFNRIFKRIRRFLSTSGSQYPHLLVLLSILGLFD